MLLAQAHSFAQQARLAITLAWVAGYTNVVTLLLCGHVTSHVSGTTSDLGRGAVEAMRGTAGAWSLTGFALYLVVTFLGGAMISGVMTELGKRRAWESIYVLPVGFEAALLATFAVLLQWGGALSADVATGPPLNAGWWLYGLTGIASVAMGVQNATISRISSGVVRTTHVTGVLTDLGLELVQWLEWLWDRRRLGGGRPDAGFLRSVGNHATSRRLLLLLSILASFALGAGLGTIAFDHATSIAMYPPVFFLAWIIYSDIAQPIAEIEPSELVTRDGLRLPASVVVFHLRRDAVRGARGAHRLPNLLAWAERLPDSVRVAILDLDQVTDLDEDAAAEIRAALARFAVEGRHLLVAGVSREQYELLRRGAGDLLHPENACTDLEIAVARGLNIAEDLETGAISSAGHPRRTRSSG
jgi:uncharacterized membrane protein YoaK (UPF0700 family)